MPRCRVSLLLLLSLGAAIAQVPAPFAELPYLQLGDAPALARQETMTVLWHAEAPGDWAVEVRGPKQQAWRGLGAPAVQTVDAPGIPKHQVYRARLTGLTPGE